MKTTRLLYLFRSIRKNLVSFFNVALIAAVGMAVLLGILSASLAIQQQANRYFVSNKLQTAEIKSANGITQADLDALKALPQIDIAEGAYSTRATLQLQREVLILQVLSLGAELNTPVILEGRLPETTDEVAIEQKFADKRGVKVGDTLALSHDGSLRSDTFTVTAIVNQPAYCCIMGKETRGTSSIGMGVVAHYMMVLPEAFDSAYFQDCYPIARIRSNALDAHYYYSEAYTRQEALLLQELEQLGARQSQLRYEELLLQAQPAIDAGLLDPDSISRKDWVISTREDTGDLRGIPLLVDTMDSISYSLSVLFMLVVVVVCYTAISRMIDEQRTQIGMQKAQGFRPREILAHYMLYNALCALAGIALGWVISVFAVEKLVLAVLNSKFLVGTCSLTFVWREALVVAAVCLTVFLLTTYLTCRKIVKLPAVELMNAGKYAAQNKPFFFEKWRWYRRRRLFTRVMLKNVLADRKRLISTIAGVLGSVTLMVICFSLKLAIDGAFDRQFDSYYFYTHRLTVDTSHGSAADFAATLEAEGVSFIPIQDKLKSYRVPGGKWACAHVLAVDPATSLDGFMRLEDATTGQALTVPTDGVLVSRKCAEINNLTAGSILEVSTNTGDTAQLRVAGIMEHYISFTYFLTSTTYYEEVMGEAADQCVFLLKSPPNGLYDRVRGMEGFMSLTDNSDFREDISIIYIVIAICLVLSAAMTFLVVLNQIIMYVDRKAIELAVMRINGYRIRETKAFIYRDNVVLAILGLLLGSGFGMGLSYVMIRIMEREIHHYVRTPNLLACLYAGAITAVFVLIVNLIGLRRIHHLNMTDVNAN